MATAWLDSGTMCFVFHLHAPRRYGLLACLKIDLALLGLAQLARPHEHEWRELQRITGHVRAAISVDGA
jgi:hypothetical protein